MKKFLLAAAVVAVCSSARAQDAPAAAAVKSPGPVEVVDLFHQSLKEGYTEKALQQLAPDALVFETGFVESTRDRYAAGHVQEDARFASGTQRKLLKRETWQEGEMAGVLSLVDVDGDFGGKKIALEQTETMILRRSEGVWRIAHVHWSAHNR